VSFFSGFVSAFRGVGTLVASPRLWPWAIAPAAAAVVLLSAALILIERWAFEPLRAWATQSLGDTEWAGWTLYAFGWIVGFVALTFVYCTFARLIAAPFLALLADSAVSQLSGRPAPAAPGGPLMRWVARPLAEALWLLAIKLAVTIVALPLLLVPVAGPVLFWIVASALLGLDFLDVALSARGILMVERLRFARSHAGACLGMGVAGSLFLMVPCLNLILLPGCVVGAVNFDQRVSPSFPRPVTA
jgi:CysZ protein